MKKQFLLSTFVLVLICSCKNNIDLDETMCLSGSKIPVVQIAQTSQAELDSLYQSDTINVIDYRIARFLASAELLSGANIALGVDPYEPWHLTSFPKVVYNYDNSPKYYEFGYLINNDVVATITTYARKEAAGVVAFLFSTPLNYDCPDLDFYVGNYPARYYGQNGVCYLKNCDEELGFAPSSDNSGKDSDIFFDFYKDIPDDDKQAMSDDIKGESIDPSEWIEKETREFWNLVDGFVANHLQSILYGEITPGDICLGKILNGESSGDSDADLITDLTDYLDYAVGYCDTFTLPNYNDPRLQLTRWKGWCGPAACAWVYRGLDTAYHKYNGRHLPVLGESNSNQFFGVSISPMFAYYKTDTVMTGWTKSNILNWYKCRSLDADSGLIWEFYKYTSPISWGEWHFPLFDCGMA